MFQRTMLKPVARSASQVLLLGLLLLWMFTTGLAATGARISIQEPVFDFKEVKEGETIRHVFRVLNQGDELLEIAKVAPG